MNQNSLASRSVLIVEDEPLIVLDIAAAFENAGAVVLTALSLSDAFRLVEEDGLSAAVVDFGLGDGNGDVLCGRLVERGILFARQPDLPWRHRGSKTCQSLRAR